MHTHIICDFFGKCYELFVNKGSAESRHNLSQVKYSALHDFFSRYIRFLNISYQNHVRWGFLHWIVDIQKIY